MKTRPVLLFLDFDGTLAPIADRPDEVSINRPMKRALARLSRHPRIRTVVVSGRSLRDLLSYMGGYLFWYGGNHGWEAKGRGLHSPMTVSKTTRYRHAARQAKSVLKKAFGSWPGVLIEDKAISVCLHYRMMPSRLMPRFLSEIRRLKRNMKYPLVWKKGKKVLELLPDFPWGKGKFAAAIVRRHPQSLVIAIGDDRTDEDMFRALNSRAITICVGRKKTAARYYLDSPAQVRTFLAKLCQL